MGHLYHGYVSHNQMVHSMTEYGHVGSVHYVFAMYSSYIGITRHRFWEHLQGPVKHIPHMKNSFMIMDCLMSHSSTGI